MNDDPEAALSAFQLADSALPVGGYAVSYGLEQFVEEGVVADAGDLETLLADYLRGHVGPCEFVVLSAAHAAGGDDLGGVAAADRRQRAVTLPAEFREGSVASGRRLLDVAGETTDDGALAAYADRVGETAPGNYAAVLGLVAARLDVPRETARLLHGHAFLRDLLGAAQRLLRLGHTEVQRLLAELRPTLASVAREYDATDPAEARSFAPAVDVMGMSHEDADRRLFVS
jgi:urease accessory protein